MAEHLAKLYPYKSMTLNKTKHGDYEKTLSPPKYPMAFQSLVGIEIEMENMPEWADVDYYWTAKKDGSLRNNGVEYVSIPLRSDQVEYAMQYLNNVLSKYNPDFSPRTSTHIHLNVRDITPEEAKNLVLLYCMFEKHFFKFANKDREESLFCVPLYASYHTQHYSKLIDSGMAYWHKYLALNLLPIVPNGDTGCYGTIEFRHLHGTKDVEHVVKFVNSILCLKKAAKSWKHSELIEFIDQANSTSAYTTLYHEIFGEHVLHNMQQYEFEYCISQLKRNLFKNVYRDTLNLKV